MTMENKITIDTFKTVTKAMAHSEDLDIMTNHLTQLLVLSLDIKGCAIFVLNPESKELEPLASFGLSQKYLSKGPVLAFQSIAANLKGEPVIVEDVSCDAQIQYPDEARKEGIASVISIPVGFAKEIMGALRLYHYESWRISDQDLDSLFLLAENIGFAMTYTKMSKVVRGVNRIIQGAFPPGSKLFSLHTKTDQEH